MNNDPRNATARAKGATNPENGATDWTDIRRTPVLYEQRIKGVTVDLRAPKQQWDPRTETWGSVMPTFTLSPNFPSDIWRWDRARGTKTHVDVLPPRGGFVSLPLPLAA